VYWHFGEVDAAGTSPLYERVAVALSESGEALPAIEAAPARKRHPTVILAALHDLALAGRAPALAAAYAAADGDAAAEAAIGRWRGCQRRGSESRRRYRPLAIAAPRATASSAWQCSAGRLCAPRPSAVAGRGAAC